MRTVMGVFGYENGGLRAAGRVMVLRHASASRILCTIGDGNEYHGDPCQIYITVTLYGVRFDDLCAVRFHTSARALPALDLTVVSRKDVRADIDHACLSEINFFRLQTINIAP
ncbi:hypothetical protein [Pseudoduganella lutea]|uniref:Uncharacterized protein n=1 Tax=Pseudoduganella lutea TaxID=321985 RepID=A0A4P6KYL1_9BURK|nr:hypothetical protein [Pseudoduganella lutea]QBE63865.1 hypothetical protein EWM63_13430 [Pseudoduganella lutea]